MSDPRYYDPDEVKKYRAQQERLSVHAMRLGLLARAERLAIRRLLPKPDSPADRLLDVPGGTGKLWADLSSSGFKIMSLDRSELMLRAGPRQTAVSLVIGDGRNLPLASDSIEGIVCLRLMHRISPQERRQVFAEFHRVGRKWLLFSYADLSGARRARFRIRTMITGDRDWAPFPTDKIGITRELEASGFKVVHRRPVVGPLSNEVLILARLTPHRRL